LRKAENGDIDAVNVWSMKISKSLLECSTITMLSTQKRSMTRNCSILLGWKEQDINFCKLTNRKCRG